MRDAIGLTLLFSATALLALVYYRTVPSIKHLRQRLPNRMSVASLVALVLIGLWFWWFWQSGSNLRLFIGTLFNFLIFESFFFILLRWIRSNTLAVILSAIAVVGFVWLQREIGGNLVYNLTFMTATLGATTLLVRMEYLRTKFLAIVAGLWVIYDILSVAFIYPQIYRIADRPQTSFIFPAVAVGQVTLGSGDFMFLVLMTTALYRDRGLRWALIHIGLQAVALFVTILVKPRDILWPYLTIMVPIFLLVLLLSRRKRVAE